MHCKEKSEGGHGLFSSGQVFHVTESFERRHSVVLDAVKIWFIGIFDIEITIPVLAHGSGTYLEGDKRG